MEDLALVACRLIYGVRLIGQALIFFFSRIGGSMPFGASYLIPFRFFGSSSRLVSGLPVWRR